MGLFRKKTSKKEPELTVEQVEQAVLGTAQGSSYRPKRRWQYKTVTRSGWNHMVKYEDSILNEVAEEGWELVQIRDAVYDSQSIVVFTFKRPW